MGTIDTRKVAGRRSLTFHTIDELRRDLDVLEAAHRAGTLRHLGNWEAGRIMAHLAAFAEYPLAGYPKELSRPPLLIRVFLKSRKNKYIRGRMPLGVKIPGIPGGTVGADDIPFDQGLSRFRSALDRLERTAPTIDNPIFGTLTHEEWMLMQCRHAEGHLGFLTV